MFDPPPEPLPVTVRSDSDPADSESLRLAVVAGTGEVLLELERPTPRKVDDPRGPVPPRRARLSSADAQNADGFLRAVADWLKVYVPKAESGATDVQCDYDGLHEGPDAHQDRWMSLHLNMTSDDLRAGLHLQFMPSTGEGLLLESHVGLPANLLLQLRRLLDPRK